MKKGRLQRFEGTGTPHKQGHDDAREEHHVTDGDRRTGLLPLLRFVPLRQDFHDLGHLSHLCPCL